MLRRIKNYVHLLLAVFWVEYYRHPAKDLYVVGITGTDGKTTTSWLLYEVLKAAGYRVGMVTTVGVKYWIPSQAGNDIVLDKGLHSTTPSPKDLQQILRTMKDAGVTHVVLETTSHALDQYRVWGCHFRIGVLTNLAHEHLDYHKTMEAYAAAKAKLFRDVEYAVLNRDDEWFGFFAKAQNDKTRIVKFGKTELKNISPNLNGDYNKYNIAAVEAVAELLGVTKRLRDEAIKNFVGVPGRRQEVANTLGIRMIVDFAHTPQALEALLKSLKGEIDKKNRLLLVFGCTGERDFEKRPVMGKIASELANVVVVTSDDLYGESQDRIYEQIVLGMADVSFPRKRESRHNWIPGLACRQAGQARDDGNRCLVYREDDRDKAIAIAVNMAKKGDIVVATGMGHEKTQRIGDREIVRSDVAAFVQATLSR